MEPLSLEVFRSVLPEKMKKNVNQELIDKVNAVLAEPELFEAYRDNLLSYTSVMKDGRFKIDQYLNAVRYVSHKLMGDSNIDAYTKTFPDKINRFMLQGVAPKDIASYVTAYHKSQLVNLIMAQTIIPVHVLNQDMYQASLNKLAMLMNTANSEKVQVEAAVALANQLRPPEVRKVELDVAVKEDSSIARLRQATMDLALQQQQLLQAGMADASQVARSRIVPAEVVDVVATEVKSQSQGNQP